MLNGCRYHIPSLFGFNLMWDWGGANGFDVDTGSTQNMHLIPLLLSVQTGEKPGTAMKVTLVIVSFRLEGEVPSVDKTEKTQMLGGAPGFATPRLPRPGQSVTRKSALRIEK